MRETEAFIPYGPLPDAAQWAYHQDELAAFVHFGPNTFTDREWGTGQESPACFNPTDIDADQWIRVFKETGFKRVIIVLKHHDGFLLYPSRYSQHSVAASPWKEGKGDLLADLSRAANRWEMPLGFYLSPWDAHHPDYHVDRQDRYNLTYLNQLKEIFENPAYGYRGRFVEVWMDGARGEGAQAVTYDFANWFDYIYSQDYPVAIFSTQLSQLRWVGNECGRAGDPLWQKVKEEKLLEAAIDYLHHGDPKGDHYSLAEVDVSLRPGWFYHAEQAPKSTGELMDIYLHSVGKGSPLLLNVPPNRDGRLADEDVAALHAFQAARDTLYRINYLQGGQVWMGGQSIDQLVTGQGCWQAPGQTDLILHLILACPSWVDVFEIREALQYGQRIARFEVEVQDVEGQWQDFGQGFTVGYRRLVKGPLVKAQAFRLVIREAQAPPILSQLALYRWPDCVENEEDSYRFESDVYQGEAGQPISITALKTEGFDQESQVILEPQPGSGVHGQVYQDARYSLTFKTGEQAQSFLLPTLAHTAGETLDFYLKMAPSGATTRLLIHPAQE